MRKGGRRVEWCARRSTGRSGGTGPSARRRSGGSRSCDSGRRGRDGGQWGSMAEGKGDEADGGPLEGAASGGGSGGLEKKKGGKKG